MCNFNKKRSHSRLLFYNGRDDTIRTCDPLVPSRYVRFTNPTITSHPFRSFYPFSILVEIQNISGFEAKSAHKRRKKDNSKDKKRIKRIIFLKSKEVPQIQTIPKLFSYSLFSIYPSGYISHFFSRQSELC